MPRDAIQSHPQCSDKCEHCIYIEEGDFMCAVTQDVTIVDWKSFPCACPKKRKEEEHGAKLMPKDTAINYLVQAQQCDLSAKLTEEMNKYPKGSPQRAILKSIRLAVAYGKPDSTINIPTDYSPEALMSRFAAIFKKEEEHGV